MKRYLLILVLVALLGVPATALASDPLGFPMREGSSSEAHKHNEEGISHFNQGHYDVALKHFQMASKIDPSVGESHYNEALALDKLGQHASASMHFKAARKNAHGRAEILNSGILMKHIGKEGS